jgi:Holliday junction DNA helicase RuvA
MKDKLEKEVFNGMVQLPAGSLSTSDLQSMEQQQESPVEDAVNALMALGYKPPEASKMVSAIAGQGETVEQLIRLALQSKVK